jgi:hypothetical protein
MVKLNSIFARKFGNCIKLLRSLPALLLMARYNYYS